MKVHVAVIGARQHYAVARMLHRAGMLGRLYTDLYRDDILPREKVVSFSSLGLWYRWSAGRRRDLPSLNRLYGRGASAFARRVIRRGLDGAELLYSYNGPSAELFRHAKERGIFCLLEQILIPQGLVRRLMEEELERWPGWEPTLRFDPSHAALEEREREEWRLADRIICPSSFVLDGLRQAGGPAEKCRLVPYGIPLETFPPKQPAARSGLLKLLFAGDVSLRKGAPYFLEALRRLDSSQVEARFAGRIALAPERLRPYQAVASFLGPVPRRKMLELYHWADLLVTPSICEGSAVVTYEALACGLPVIATSNAGSVVRDSVDGVIVPARDVEALAGVIETFARDPERIRSFSRKALERREELGLDALGQRLIRVIEETAGEPRPEENL